MTLDNHGYDEDCITYSPSGKLFQIDYATEASNLGSAALAIKSKEHIIFCAIKKNPGDLSELIDKIYQIDDHLICTASGLTADINILIKKMRSKCVSKDFVLQQQIPPVRLVSEICEKLQYYTMRYDTRPVGCSLIIGGFDDRANSQLFQTFPSGSYAPVKAAATGERSQAALTFLEKNGEQFFTDTKENLILKAIEALRATINPTQEFNEKHCSLVILSNDNTKETLLDSQIKEYIQRLPERIVTVPAIQ
ncbi:MAG: hypothetical protein MHMPM18_000712 [Marteilia pararefringens]